MKAKEPSSTFSHEVIHHIVDGDGFITRCQLTGRLTEFRLLGIDAPEIKPCSKLRQDEKETHMAAALLIKLGQESRKHLESLLPIGSKVIIEQEANNQEDVYGRQLAYAYAVPSASKNTRQEKKIKPSKSTKNKSPKNSATPINQIASIEQELSINEQMVLDGYAKPYDKTYCELLPKIQENYLEAKIKRAGLFSLIDNW